MKDINKIAGILIIILILLLIYLVITGNSNIREAQKKIVEIENGLKLANDNLNKAQNNINEVIDKLTFAEKELKVNKYEREVLLLQEEKSRAATWDILMDIKKEMKIKEQEKAAIVEELKKYK